MPSKSSKKQPTPKTEVAVFAESVRRAISFAIVQADNRWTAQATHPAGTTATLVLVSGWLVTVANVGDSGAALDAAGAAGGAREATVSHRIQANASERARLRAGGALLAPLGFHLQGPAKPNEMGVGPLRMWPGGLCVGRSIGDMDAGPLVVPLPHVRQVMSLPRGLCCIVVVVWFCCCLSYGGRGRGGPDGSLAFVLCVRAALARRRNGARALCR